MTKQLHRAFLRISPEKKPEPNMTKFRACPRDIEYHGQCHCLVNIMLESETSRLRACICMSGPGALSQQTSRLAYPHGHLGMANDTTTVPSPNRSVAVRYEMRLPQRRNCFVTSMACRYSHAAIVVLL